MGKMAALAFLAAEINRDMSRAAPDQRSETDVPHDISFWGPLPFQMAPGFRATTSSFISPIHLTSRIRQPEEALEHGLEIHPT
jgi:hypothetical protein